MAWVMWCLSGRGFEVTVSAFGYIFRVQELGNAQEKKVRKTIQRVVHATFDAE